MSGSSGSSKKGGPPTLFRSWPLSRSVLCRQPKASLSSRRSVRSPLAPTLLVSLGLLAFFACFVLGSNKSLVLGGRLMLTLNLLKLYPGTLTRIIGLKVGSVNGSTFSCWIWSWRRRRTTTILTTLRLFSSKAWRRERWALSRSSRILSPVRENDSRP